MQCACGHTNDADAQSSVQKRLIEIGAFVWWHAAIFTSLAVEDQVDCKECTTEDGAAIDEALGQVALCDGIGGRGSLVGAARRGLEGGANDALLEWRELLGCRCRADSRDGLMKLLLLGRGLEGSQGESGGRGYLFGESGGEGEGSPCDEGRHDGQDVLATLLLSLSMVEEMRASSTLGGEDCATALLQRVRRHDCRVSSLESSAKTPSIT